MKQSIVLIEAEGINSGFIRTAHLFPSVEAAESFIKKEMDCSDDEELQSFKVDTPSPDCKCYAFDGDDYIFHIYTNPAIG